MVPYHFRVCPYLLVDAEAEADDDAAQEGHQEVAGAHHAHALVSLVRLGSRQGRDGCHVSIDVTNSKCSCCCTLEPEARPRPTLADGKVTCVKVRAGCTCSRGLAVRVAYLAVVHLEGGVVLHAVHHAVHGRARVGHQCGNHHGVQQALAADGAQGRGKGR